jgi:hypothetical protein
MANIPIKGSITQAAANGYIDSEMNLDKSKGNAFRIDRVELQITDFDALATGDRYTMQIVSNEKTDIIEIDDPHEILTLGEEYTFAAAGVTNEQIRVKKTFPNLESFITQNKFWIGFKTVGQDAAETLNYKIYGQYVNLKQKDLDRIKDGALFE